VVDEDEVSVCVCALWSLFLLLLSFAALFFAVCLCADVEMGTDRRTTPQSTHFESNTFSAHARYWVWSSIIASTSRRFCGLSLFSLKGTFRLSCTLSPFALLFCLAAFVSPSALPSRLISHPSPFPYPLPPSCSFARSPLHPPPA
jgi:hypothetical protein